MNGAHDNAQVDREALECHRDSLTHAVTVPQPLAWAIAAGHCPVLMSDTRPDMRHEWTLIGIHAGRGSWGVSLPTALRAELGRVMTDVEVHAAGVRGALIGVARLVGVVAMRRVWDGAARESLVRFTGRSVFNVLASAEELRIRPWWRSGSKWGLLLAEAVLLSEPIPMRGAGGLWRIPGSLPLSGWGAGRTTRITAVDWALEQWRKARGA